MLYVFAIYIYNSLKIDGYPSIFRLVFVIYVSFVYTVLHQKKPFSLQDKCTKANNSKITQSTHAGW